MEPQTFSQKYALSEKGLMNCAQMHSNEATQCSDASVPSKISVKKVSFAMSSNCRLELRAGS